MQVLGQVLVKTPRQGSLLNRMNRSESLLVTFWLCSALVLSHQSQHVICKQFPSFFILQCSISLFHSSIFSIVRCPSGWLIEILKVPR